MRTWQAGETAALRGMYNGRPWIVQSALVVHDSPQETVLLLMPGAECVMPYGYIHKKHGDHRGWERWQETLDPDWKQEKFYWHTNRLLMLLEPERYYASVLIWNHLSGAFGCYYINFQLPYQRSQCGFDTFDLELDIVIDPDFQWHWKDTAEYEEGIRQGVLRPEWVRGIEAAQAEVFERIDKHLYPINAHWRDWRPDPAWSAPRLPEGWDV